MNKQQIEQWLLSKVEQQIVKAQDALALTIDALDDRDWKLASEQHRQVDYWLSRIKNSQRLIEELE
jgi:hypothetical protein